LAVGAVGGEKVSRHYYREFRGTLGELSVTAQRNS